MSFLCTWKDQCKGRVFKLGTVLEFIPGGYTSKLQNMDVGFNKPLKEGIRNRYEDWLLAEYTVDKNYGCKPTRSKVAGWLWEAWVAIPAETGANTSRKIGLIVATTATGWSETISGKSQTAIRLSIFSRFLS